MLNTNITQKNITQKNISQKLDFHSVSGLMCKSHPKSIICKTDNRPYLLDMENPTKYGSGCYGKK